MRPLRQRLNVSLVDEKPEQWSVDLGLVAQAVFDALRIKVLLDVFGDSTLHSDRVYPPHIFIYTVQTRLSVKPKKKREHKTNLGFANAPPSSSLG